MHTYNNTHTLNIEIMKISFSQRVLCTLSIAVTTDTYFRFISVIVSMEITFFSICCLKKATGRKCRFCLSLLQLNLLKLAFFSLYFGASTSTLFTARLCVCVYMCVCVCVCVCVCERERERQRQTETDTETNRDRQTDRQRQTETETESVRACVHMCACVRARVCVNLRVRMCAR